MLPLDAAGAVLIFSHFIAAGGEIDDPFFALPSDFTAAVKITRRVSIHFHTGRFGLGKVVDTVGGQGRHCQQREEKRYKTEHSELPVKTSSQRSGRGFLMQSVSA